MFRSLFSQRLTNYSWLRSRAGVLCNRHSSARPMSKMTSDDLKAERATSRLNLLQLTELFDGGKDLTQRRRKMEAIAEADPRFDISNRHFVSREESLMDGFKKSVAFASIMEERRQKGEYMHEDDQRLLRRAMNDEFPIVIHYLMFIPTIESQGTEEQKKKWLPLTEDHRILGGYAQTEMGHGTFIRGLETTATYDPQTEEFVLHSPTLSSTKWWMGGLGHFCNYTVLVARLLTRGKDYGTHLFLVQLRSLKDHTPMPGITVGDIGPKFGYAANDNGFLKFDNVRIPRENMLMRHAQVLPDGTYVKPAIAKVSYRTMVWVRSTLVRYAGDMLSRACTIATRYSAVRRQSQIREEEPEVQILSFLTQQYKLFPLIATAYALMIAGHNMMHMYTVVQAEMDKGNMDSLPELHATSAALKAFSTEVASQGIEVCRLCCGGHGYSKASGLPFIYANFSISQTYEGENTVMYLQAARSLLKLYSQHKTAASLHANMQYLAIGSDFHLQLHSPVHRADQWLDSHYQLEAYRQRARRLMARAATRYNDALRQGTHPGDAWNGASVDFVTAAKAHCHMTVVSYFIDALSQYSFTPDNEAIMKALCDLYALHGIVENAAGFMNDGYLDSSQIELARQQVFNLLAVIRREAVPLVDAFDHSDRMLDSVLGCYDGRVYERMYEWARRAPSNKKQVHDAYHKHLKGFLSPKAKL